MAQLTTILKRLHTTSGNLREVALRLAVTTSGGWVDTRLNSVHSVTMSMEAGTNPIQATPNSNNGTIGTKMGAVYLDVGGNGTVNIIAVGN